MASCPNERSYGYESSRFEKDVDEHLHCSICYNVLKEPRTCRNNDHMFCLDCITEHLTVNTQTCPECNEYLSADSLRRPRVVNNILSKLKIKCDYASRGCPEFVRVEELKTHVESCGFSPVLCSNEECGMEINRQNKFHHETKVCEYRKVKSRDFRLIQEVLARLEGNLTELNEQVEATKKDRREVKNEMKAVKDKVEAITGDQQDIKKEVQDVKKEVRECCFKVKKDIDAVKVMIRQILESLNMLELLNIKLPPPTEGNTPKEDVLIAGGFWSSRITETYSWEKKRWLKMSEMNEKHVGASSFFYKNQLFIAGGENSKTIETYDFNKSCFTWIKLPGELSYGCSYHQTVVYGQRIIHIGGFKYDGRGWSNVISELKLSSPFSMEELCHMPEPRHRHCAEIFGDKVLIMGGVTGPHDVLDSVLKFDVTKNECTEMPPLPRALRDMATVPWRDKAIVLGGEDEYCEVLNDVFMYDCKTGKITALPSMLRERAKCCAVITGNTIVVMGGYDGDSNVLNTVECFTMGGYMWEYLPAMNVARIEAIAEVLPSTEKKMCTEV